MAPPSPPAPPGPPAPAKSPAPPLPPVPPVPPVFACNVQFLRVITPRLRIPAPTPPPPPACPAPPEKQPTQPPASAPCAPVPPVPPMQPVMIESARITEPKLRMPAPSPPRPSRMVMPEMVTLALEAMLKTRLAPLPLTVRLVAPGPVMETELVTSNPPLVRLIAPVISKRMASGAVSIASRSEPGPLSAKVVTVAVPPGVRRVWKVRSSPAKVLRRLVTTSR